MYRYPNARGSLSGLGKAAAQTVTRADAAFAWVHARLALERGSGDFDKLPSIITPEDASRFMHKAYPRLATDPQEQTFVMCIGPRRKPLAVARVYIGNLNNTPSNPANILRPVLLTPSTAFIKFHTHPVGGPTPSQADIRGTEALIRSAIYVGLTLIDHIVLSPDPHRFTSIRELQPDLWRER